MTPFDSIQTFRLRVIERAKRNGVSSACREFGVSRTVFYRWRKRFLAYGPDGLHPRRMTAARGRPSSVAPQLERRVVAQSLAYPFAGPQRLSDELGRESIQIAPSTVYRILRRLNLSTRAQRIGIVEAHSAKHTGLLTERTRRQLQTARGRSGQHIQADVPGELVSLDCFYIGKLKGVGKVWQITACDVASSFAFAQILPGPAPTSQQSADFLESILIPAYKTAGWTLQRVLTDHGSEFRGAFDVACQLLGVRHVRIKPRHCWTNGFVERLQGTILHEHWRVAFRRRYFTSRRQLQHSLSAFLDYYNHHRPHRGYRLRGHSPATRFLGALR